MIDPSEEFSSLENALRGAAPELPPGLKSRTMANCASKVAAKQQRQRRQNMLLICAFGAILTTQGLGLALVDGENNRLMAGNAAPTTFSTVSVVQALELLQDRSRQLTAWMEQSTSKFKSG